MSLERTLGMRTAALVTCGLVLAFAGIAYAAAGDFDHSFSQDGRRTIGFAGTKYAEADDVAVDHSGRIVVVGWVVLSNDVEKFTVVRLKPNGAFDASFSSNGKRTFGFPGASYPEAHSVAIDGQGRIVLAGSVQLSGSGPYLGVARLKADGTLDHNFSGDGRRIFGLPGGVGRNYGADVAVDSSSRIVVAIQHELAGYGSAFGVARLVPNGDLDPSFSGDGKRTFGFPGGIGSDVPRGIAVGANGRVILAGQSDAGFPTGTNFAVAVLTAHGQFEDGFGSHGRTTIDMTTNCCGADGAYGVTTDRKDRVVVAGVGQYDSGSNEDFAVLRLDSTGAPDPAFSQDGRLLIDQPDYGGAADDLAKGVAVDPSGRIVLGGYSNEGGNAGFEFAVARVRPGGGLDTSFSGDGGKTFGFSSGTGVADIQYGSVAIDAGGRIVLVGVTNPTGDLFAVARLKGS